MAQFSTAPARLQYIPTDACCWTNSASRTYDDRRCRERTVSRLQMAYGSHGNQQPEPDNASDRDITIGFGSEARFAPLFGTDGRCFSCSPHRCSVAPGLSVSSHDDLASVASREGDRHELDFHTFLRERGGCVDAHDRCDGAMVDWPTWHAR